MTVKEFISAFREAFGEKAGLPVAFWYSDEPFAEPERVNGCIFKAFAAVRDGKPASLGIDQITCGGGRFYTGFTPMPERVPSFVSLTEKYKRTPEMVRSFIEDFGVPAAAKPWLNFTRIDLLESLDAVEGLIFFATPDILAGLTTWAFLDNNGDDAVSAPFSSGCGATIAVAVRENRRNGRRTFIGGFDPSVRPWLGAAELTFTIPASRLGEMLATMRESCLYGTHAWEKVRERIEDYE
jgi:hypothetical protein